MIEDFCHLPPMSTTPVVHLELWISPRIFEKIRNSPNGILRGLGETDSWKKPEVEKLRDTVPLIFNTVYTFGSWPKANDVVTMLLQNGASCNSCTQKQGAASASLNKCVTKWFCFKSPLIDDESNHFCKNIFVIWRESLLETNHKNSIHNCHMLKGQCHEIFDFWFFSWISFPQALSIPLEPFQIFLKIRGDIRSSRCTTVVVDTGSNWKKSSIIKVFVPRRLLIPALQ